MTATDAAMTTNSENCAGCVTSQHYYLTTAQFQFRLSLLIASPRTPSESPGTG